MYLFPYLYISSKNFSKAELKTLLSQGMYFSIASIATLLITKFDSFFLGKTYGLETVTKFYISIKIIAISEKLFSTLINNLRPYISNFYGQNKFHKIYSFYELSVPLILIFSFIIFPFLMLINERFLKLWVGRDFFIGNNFIILFGLYTILNILALPARIILTSTLYKLKIHSLLRVLEGAVRLSIILLFIKHVQIIILPLSSLISSLLFGFISLHLVIKSFFISHAIVTENKYLYFLLATLLLLVLNQALFNLAFTPFILLFFGLLLMIHFYIYNRKKVLHFLHLLKMDK